MRHSSGEDLPNLSSEGESSPGPSCERSKPSDSRGVEWFWSVQWSRWGSGKGTLLIYLSSKPAWMLGAEVSTLDQPRVICPDRVMVKSGWAMWVSLQAPWLPCGWLRWNFVEKMSKMSRRGPGGSVHDRNLYRFPPLWKDHTQVHPQVHLSETGTKKRGFLFPSFFSFFF